MNGFSRYCVVFLLSITATFTNATLIDNGSFTTDTSSGLDWLDLTATTGQSYNSIIGGFGGYAAAGYVHASLDQICGLWTEAGAFTPLCLSQNIYTDEAVSQVAADLLVSLLGSTVGGSNSYGIFIDSQTFTQQGNVGLGCIQASIVGCGNFTPGVSRNISWGRAGSDVNAAGNFLVRSAISVPEPGSFTIFALGLISVLSRRLAKKLFV